MLRSFVCVLFTVGLLSMAGCEEAAEQALASDDRAHDPGSAGHHAPEHDHHSHADAEGLPLLPIMMQMQGHMSALMQALWLENYADMATHARAVAAHVPISAAELERIKSTLGPEMAAFEAADEVVHDASHGLLAAAEAEDMEAFLGNLATVQRGCVACHSDFRERLRTTR